MRLFVLAALIASLGACTSIYHPEYRPVSVSHVVLTGQTPVTIQPVTIQQTPVNPGVPFEFFGLQDP